MKHYKDEDWAKQLLPGGNRLINLSTGEEEIMQPISKMYDCELKDFSERERAFTATASTETPDRDKDILRANGWKLKNYRKNPVVLWGHDANALPIAKAKEVKVDNGKLIFRPQFATAEQNPFAEQVFQMFKAGFLRAFSVRFDPIEWTDIKQDDDDKTNNIFYRTPRDYTSQELLEISAVNIPANPEALKSPAMHDFIVKSYMASNIKLFPQYDFTKNTKPEFECECIECGHKMTTDKHCKDIKCPECGGQMRRAERPGPGHASFDFTDDLKEKREKLEKLLRDKELRKAEQSMDDEIANLENEIAAEKSIEELQNKLNELQVGITGLVKK